MPAQDEYAEKLPPPLWSPDGKPREKCSVTSCHYPAIDRGRCRFHLGNPTRRRLRDEVRKKGLDALRKRR